MKVGIVGCGTPGAYLAWKLSENHDVTVFEKKNIIGKIVCSGLVSKRLWDFVPKNENLIENRINRVIIHFKKKDVELKLNPTMVVLSHQKLDQYVASLAKKSGAKILINNAVQNVSPDGKLEADRNYEFDRIIGCDGAESIVRKKSGFSEPNFRLGIQAHVNEKDDSDFTEVWPTRNGFIWKIPRGNSIEYGIMEDVKEAKILFERFSDKRGINYKTILSTLIPEPLVLPAAKDKIALCGDAAAQNKGWSGGGILWNLTAANVLLKTFPDFVKYNSELETFFKPKIVISKIARKSGLFFAENIPLLVPKEVKFDSDWIF